MRLLFHRLRYGRGVLAQFHLGVESDVVAAHAQQGRDLGAVCAETEASPREDVEDLPER